MGVNLFLNDYIKMKTGIVFLRKTEYFEILHGEIDHLHNCNTSMTFFNQSTADKCPLFKLHSPIASMLKVICKICKIKVNIAVICWKMIRVTSKSLKTEFFFK